MDYIRCMLLVLFYALSSFLTLKHFSTWCLASAIGPIVGGALSETGQWRWVFCELHDIQMICYSYNNML